MRLLAPLRHALFARFFAGQAVSQLGDGVFFVALAWQVIVMTAAPGALGIVTGAYMGGQLLLLLAGGVIVDRFPRRHIVVISDVIQGALAAVTAAVALSGSMTVGLLAGIAALFGAAQAFAMPALASFVPETVPAADLQSAMSLFEGTRNVSYIAGPAIGAGLIAVAGTGGAFAFNAASFAASAALLASARPVASAARKRVRAKTSMLTEVREGFRYTTSVPWLWITILVFTVVNAAEAGPRNAVLPVFVTRAFGSGPEGVGLLLSAQAAGSLMGFLAMGALPPVKRPGLVSYVATAVTAVTIGALAWTTALWQALALSAVRGVAFAAFGLLWHTSIQTQVPEGVRGRVFSLDMLGSFALLPLAMPAAGFAAEAVGARTTFLVGGAVVLAAAAVGLLYRPARAFSRAEGWTPPAQADDA